MNESRPLFFRENNLLFVIYLTNKHGYEKNTYFREENQDSYIQDSLFDISMLLEWWRPLRTDGRTEKGRAHRPILI